MDLLTRADAARRLGRNPETIRRAIVAGELEEVVGADGVRGIPYESLARYAAVRRVPDFFLTAATGSNDATDEVAANFWPIIAAAIEREVRLEQIRADARAMAQAGQLTDARIAQDWAALAEFAEVVRGADAWRVRLPAAGLVMPITQEVAARLFGAPSAEASTPQAPVQTERAA